jgi:cell filamentation protein
MSYVLDDGVTLKNLVGATDDRTLDRLATSYTKHRIDSLLTGGGPAPTFDIAYLKALHGYIFQDVFEWAGRTRDERVMLSDGTAAYVATIRKLTKFTDSADIPAELDALFAGLKADKYLQGLPRGAFAAKAADFLVRLNAIHPFREGNGRTQRAFLAALGRAAGHEIAFDIMSKRLNTDASIDSDPDDPAPWRDLMAMITDPDHIAALRGAVRALAKEQPDYANKEIRLLEPGVPHLLVMTLKTPDHFVAWTPDNKLVAGWRRDLGDPEPKIGSAFEITIKRS